MREPPIIRKPPIAKQPPKPPEPPRPIPSMVNNWNDAKTGGDILTFLADLICAFTNPSLFRLRQEMQQRHEEDRNDGR